MKNKIKNFLIPLFLMFLTNLGYYYLTNAPNFGGEINPHLGILFIAALFFGPYGALGAVIANGLCDVIRGYSISITVVSAIISFAISYLVYKLWYTKNPEIAPITKPRLNNLNNMIYLLIIIFISSALYSLLTANITGVFYPNVIDVDYEAMRYFVNFMNFALLFSMLLMILSRYKDFSYIPEISGKTNDGKKYGILFGLIVIITLASIAANIIIGKIYELYVIETVVLLILLFLYNRKPITSINQITYSSITEKIMISFIILSIIFIVIDRLIIFSPVLGMIVDLIKSISVNQKYLLSLQLLDVIIILFAIPSLVLIGYIERKIIKPLLAFSKIEPFIKENEKIESEGLINIYSDYIDEDDEIGILSRSYTNLIENNNSYIENMKTLEIEKERMSTELRIAQKIQEATLPKKAIINEEIKIEGYCKPAKEVGGDFYDFYELDEDNVMIIIGDASGKGVPAALFTLIIQNSIKILMKNELDPAKVLSDVNNQICENNPEMMFITLFLGIYNKKTHELTYANAGHNPPLIKINHLYELFEVDSEIALGVLEDYVFKNHEIKLEEELILYTDGITDAQNKNHELYGEKKLVNFLNNHESNGNIMEGLVDDINKFTDGEQQFDDMTLLVLAIK